MTGVEQIAAERQRQIDVEGFDTDHDEEHDYHELASAAYCYLTQLWEDDRPPADPPQEWPWEPEWWKPSNDPLRNLIKAGALIAAEIDHMGRADG